MTPAGGTLRALGLLGRVLVKAYPPLRPEPASGIPCDWYEARGRRRAVAVALHGVTPNGKDDHRLQGFARALAASGTTCAVPRVPGLADLRWDPSDVGVVGRVVEAAAEATSSRVVIVGFSHGGSVALLAAARPQWAQRISYVLSFGAYHSLARSLAGLSKIAEPARAADWDDFVFAHLVLAHRHGEALRLEPALREAVDDLLHRYCGHASDEEKRRFFDRHLRPLDLVREEEARRDPAALAALSPEGQLAGLLCPVGLVHDPGDLLVPVSEAHALFAELSRFPPSGGGSHRLLVTRLMRHVTPSGVFRIGEALRLARMAAPLVGG